MVARKKHSKSKPKSGKLRVGISVGDINGIGLEVIIKTFLDSRMFEICTPVIYVSHSMARAHRKLLGIQDFSFQVVEDADKANSKKTNVIEVWKEEVPLEIGNSTAEGGKYAFLSLDAATRDLAANKLDVLVTAPINKHNIQSEDFPFAGHTEYLANYANEDHPLMILAHDNLRMGTVTGHVALKDVAGLITKELIVKKLEIFNKSLIQDFGLTRPNIAVLGLNPHSGDNGTIGKEEQEIIIPAIEEAFSKGIRAFGPFPSDGFMGSPNYKKYDGILSMYHDQGLTPFKVLSFDQGVNFTAGLPIVRTSPDHGTGYDIAGKNVASEQSFRNAVYLALEVFRNRKDYRKLSENPLKKAKIRDNRGD
ncbi:4-hydroxythreonine-4-phosphate dehydrogenase PdxA [bacterium SCSIO 12741]|nr:4-hydroxythreonine-4-phosphate dehydrogenase PdxA [bacterium SCSIO 12741]